MSILYFIGILGAGGLVIVALACSVLALTTGTERLIKFGARIGCFAFLALCFYTCVALWLAEQALRWLFSLVVP